jgi:hypothetical protein
MVTTCTARLTSERVRFKPLSAAPKPVCIAAGHRQSRSAEKPLAVLLEELRQAAQAWKQTSPSERTQVTPDPI